VKGIALYDDLGKSEAERVDLLLDFIKSKLESGSICLEDEKEIVSEANRLNIANKAPIILCELLLAEKVLSQVSIQKLSLRFIQKSMKVYFGIDKALQKVVFPFHQ